jgi:acyl-CoA reductase-like NAD-dependent aldehyde dehydrogenase
MLDRLAPNGPLIRLWSVQMHKTAYVEYQPLGVLGIIAPWNYPFHNLYTIHI